MKTKRTYSVSKVVSRLLIHAAKCSKQVFVYFFFYTITAAATPLILSLLPKVYLDAFLKGQGISYILMLSLIYFLIAGTLGFIKNISPDYSPRQAVEVLTGDILQ